jgi:hypothetical protein
MSQVDMKIISNKRLQKGLQKQSSVGSHKQQKEHTFVVARRRCKFCAKEAQESFVKRL